jgi:hypothetical protein
LQVLIEYLVVGGLVERSGGMLRKRPTATNPEIAEPLPIKEEIAPEIKEAPRSNVKTLFSQTPAGRVQFHIDVDVDMAEFASWQSDRITAFFTGLAQVLAAKADIEKKG